MNVRRREQCAGKQLRPVDLILGLPIGLDQFCEGLRAAALALYSESPELSDRLRREAKDLEYLRSDRACIETDHPSLPANDAPASAFVAWRADTWRNASDLAQLVARADQHLGRNPLLACFNRRKQDAEFLDVVACRLVPRACAFLQCARYCFF